MDFSKVAKQSLAPVSVVVKSCDSIVEFRSDMEWTRSYNTEVRHGGYRAAPSNYDNVMEVQISSNSGGQYGRPAGLKIRD